MRNSIYETETRTDCRVHELFHSTVLPKILMIVLSQYYDAHIKTEQFLMVCVVSAVTACCHNVTVEKFSWTILLLHDWSPWQPMFL